MTPMRVAMQPATTAPVESPLLFPVFAAEELDTEVGLERSVCVIDGVTAAKGMLLGVAPVGEPVSYARDEALEPVGSTTSAEDGLIPDPVLGIFKLVSWRLFRNLYRGSGGTIVGLVQ